MNELQIFNNPEFGEIRTLEEEGKVLFCASDVAKALGYIRPNDAIASHCRSTVKRRIPHPQSHEKTIEMSFIPESDVYRLSFGSKLPTAERLTDWIVEEVIPTIRKHGAYMTPEVIERTLTDPDYIIQLATTLKEERQKRRVLEAKAEENRPKVLFADSVAASQTSILIFDLAKILKQNGVNIGGNRLFEWMRKKGYLVRRKGSDYNMPTQRSMELGLFEVKETSVSHSDGHISVNKTPKVTGKGQQYFINAFLGKGNAAKSEV